jgi:hypothetical protein
MEQMWRLVDSTSSRWWQRLSSYRTRATPASKFQVGPTFFYLLRFSNTHTLIFQLVTFFMSKFFQIFHRDIRKHKEQLSFLAQLQIPKGLQVIIFAINSNLNLP